MRWKILPIIVGCLLFVQIKAKPKSFVLSTTPSENLVLTTPGEGVVGLETTSENLVLTTPAEEVTGLETSSENLVLTTPAEGLISPTISKFHITSNIQFRYAHTQVLSYVKNPSSEAKQISFTAVIPDSAFISNFSMVIQGKEYIAEVKDKEEAKKEYEEAVTEGKGGGLVSEDARDANTFIVAANVEAGDKVEFKLTYEELLERKLGQYEYAINVNPGQVVENLRIEVFINESRPIKSLFVPELRESNEINFEENQMSEIAKVSRNVDGEASKAQITFSPNTVYQKSAGEQGLSGHFIVQYDVDRSGQDNEVQVIDGYFVHFFTPENLPTLPKHVIFVLDTSGSMDGEKMNQLKDAMFTILNDMTEKDFFNIILFSSGVSQWDPKFGNFTILVKETDYPEDSIEFSNTDIQGKTFAIEAAHKNNKKDVIDKIIELPAEGGTNLNAGLLEGLKMAKFSKFAKGNEILPEDVQSMIVFLSDGQATEGVTNSSEIKENIKKANSFNVPIYSLGFGEDADFNLIKGISASSGAFSKHIYEGSDAAIQLENFFAEISNPLLANVKFDYVGGLVNNSSVSESEVRTFFKGGEFVVTGKLLDNQQNESTEALNVTVTGDGRNGTQFVRNLEICFRPGPGNDSLHLNDYLQFPCTFLPPRPPRSQPQNFLQKLHAFINIKQLLKKQYKTVATLDEEADEESFKEKALKLALENNFVTELTSLVVVRPDEEPTINNLITENKHSYDGLKIVHVASFSFPDYYDDEEHFDITNTTETIQDEERSPCSGSITLFSKTYLRGENKSYTEDTGDLIDFDKKLVTLEVKGNCCWIIFTDLGYEGNSQSFGEGKYTSLVQVKKVFRKASSLQKKECMDVGI